MSPSGKTTMSINSKEKPENNNAQVLKKIKEEFEHTYPNEKKRNLKLPSGINFMVDGNTVTMQLSTACANVQKDESAFEGWALVVRRWGMYEKVNIMWEKPADIADGHYQRFLFRLSNFYKDFKPWFSIDENCQPFLNDLRIKGNKSYLLNIQDKNSAIKEPNDAESKLERRFVTEGDSLREHLMKLTMAKFIDRQLPVGVFENAVAEKNKILPGRKSAIDLWGISIGNELLLFELKAEKPKVSPKVGIVSELYLYVCVMQMLRKGNFKYENCGDARISKIAGTKKIIAYFLAPELHPLIDKNIIEELNQTDVEYHFLKIINENSFLIAC